MNLRAVEKPVRNLSQIERKILDFLSILSNFYNFKGKIRKKELLVKKMNSNSEKKKELNLSIMNLGKIRIVRYSNGA